MQVTDKEIQPCKTSQRIRREILLEEFTNFTAVVGIISASINAQFPSNYIGSFLESRNQFPFTTNLGVRANGYISDYTITTDTSLLPFTVE